MRLSPTRLHRQRAHLDTKLDNVRPALAQLATPRGGWMRAIRESLGMSAQQLGKRLGISKQGVANLERNEVRKTLSLESLERAARALGCRVVYALVPDEPLESQLDTQAIIVARKKLQRVRHSMALEDQRPPDELHELQVKELAKKLKEHLSSDLWDGK
jgi:predicted DNA-binding mobile mystery protein A